MQKFIGQTFFQLILITLLLAGMATGFSVVFASSESNGASNPISNPVSPTPTPTATPISNPVSPTPSPTSAPDTIAPTILITAPQNGSYIKKGSSLTISANAVDNVGVVRVAFFVNGLIICNDTGAPFNCVYQVSKQPRVKYLITATAYDAANNSASHSVNVTSK